MEVHQNGVARRMTRALLESGRCMRVHAGLPKEFWAESVSTAAYLFNRSPVDSLGGEFPEKAWSGKEVCLSHFGTFGCVVNVRSLMHDSGAMKCYLLGYGDEDGEFRCWDPMDRKVIRVCDVVIDETVLYKDTRGGRFVNSGMVEEERGLVVKEGALFDGISNEVVEASRQVVLAPCDSGVVLIHGEQGIPPVSSYPFVERSHGVSPRLPSRYLCSLCTSISHGEMMRESDLLEWEHSEKSKSLTLEDFARKMVHMSTGRLGDLMGLCYKQPGELGAHDIFYSLSKLGLSYFLSEWEHGPKRWLSFGMVLSLGVETRSAEEALLAFGMGLVRGRSMVLLVSSHGGFVKGMLGINVVDVVPRCTLISGCLILLEDGSPRTK